MNPIFAFTPGLFDKQAAAHYLSKSGREIDELRSTGHLIAVGTGKRVFFTREELDRYIASLPERDSTVVTA